MGNRNHFICCICGKLATGYGNNPDGAVWKDGNDELHFPTFNEDDRCCDECNWNFVIPGRLYNLKAN